MLAARLLVHAAVLEGLYGQAFPIFGGERRGAPVHSFARISDRPVRLRSQIREPDVLVVFDKALLSAPLLGVKSGGLLVANASSRPSGPAGRTFWVDATAIARALGLVVAGWPIVNTAMLGALARVWGLVPLRSVREAILETWSGELGELNVKAAEEAYARVVGGG